MKLDILSTFTKGGKPVSDLTRFAALCDALGNPQNALKFIHVAGTNGKGSVSEFMSCGLAETGNKTGKFTSPYVYDIRERIQLNNRTISSKDFYEYVKRAAEASERLGENGGALSQFEILTAAAFLYFKQKKADIVILETGIGGLLDCTNIVEPELCVITAVGYDHSDILGSALSDIARHKAGIIKSVSGGAPPCVAYPALEREAYVEVRKQCEKTGAELIIPDADKLTDEKISIYGNSFVYNNVKYSTMMGGKHQVLNALTAIEALKRLDIPEKHIKTGLKTAQLPARLQIIRKNPLVVLDGAHNRQGIAAAKAVFAPWRVHMAVVFGTLEGKDYLGALMELCSFAHYFIFTDGFAENAVSCSDLYRAASLFGIPGEFIYTVGEAKRAVELAAEFCGVVLVTGSLRLAGAINN